jgi:hypothetical protein
MKCTFHKGIAEITILGTLVLWVTHNLVKIILFILGRMASKELGHMVSLAANAKLICIEYVVIEITPVLVLNVK